MTVSTHPFGAPETKMQEAPAQDNRLLEAFDITQPTLSHHMRVLCDCGLVCVRREGKWSHYSLCCETFSAFKDFIGKLECCKNEKGGCDCG